MDEPVEGPLSRLRELAKGSDGVMAVPEIIEAVAGIEMDSEIVSLVKSAFESNEKALSLEEIVQGVTELILWREVNC